MRQTVPATPGISLPLMTAGSFRITAPNRDAVTIPIPVKQRSNRPTDRYLATEAAL
jgi:hypothetical protein